MGRLIIVGAGAAGLMAAIHAGRAGCETLVLERNEKAGKKIYITGKGRCNCTHDCGVEDFLREVPQNPRFLYSALRFFGPRDLMNLLEQAGCPVTVQRGQRVFPSSEKASDVTRTLLKECAAAGAEIRLTERVRSVTVAGGRVTGVLLESGKTLPADAVLLATGGWSYPATGSTGDGYRMAADLGHTVFPPRPSLSAMETEESWPATLQGLSLKNVRLQMKRGKRVLYEELGEMLFTHFGVSGPLVLEGSCHLPEDPSGVQLELDLKPGLTQDQLDARLRRDFAEAGKKQLRSVLPGLLPRSLAEIFPGITGLPAEILCSQVTGAQRAALVAALKGLRLTVHRLRPVEEAIVTRGGVSVREINPGTMESKLVSGLYFAGELIDTDAHTGGFNLQIAFSTGALAGYSAATRGI